MNKQFIFLKSIIVLSFLCLFISCDKNEDDGQKDILTFGDSYSLVLDGSHPDGTINERVTVEPNDVIGIDKIKVIRTNDYNLSIDIYIKAGSGVSDVVEHLGMSLQCSDKIDGWRDGGTFKAFYRTQSSGQSKKSNVSYFVEKDNYFYDANYTFNTGEVTLEPVTGDHLKGKVSFKMQNPRDSRIMNVNGTFDANLAQDGL